MVHQANGHGKKALVVGSTGIVGNNLCQQLLGNGWTVYGLARNPKSELSGLQPIAADLMDAGDLKAKLKDLLITHVFLTTWSRQKTEAENIKINGTMVKNLLAAFEGTSTLQHVALVTGLKHYLGPFEAYGKGTLPETPFREEQPRLAVENFYYAQEDEVFAAAKRQGFSWSVHRPHTIIGYAVGNAMNMGTTLAVYATICKETGKPFQFPGSATQWNGLTDMTDARLLAKHLEWAATTPSAVNQAFNVVNGDIFRWKWLWERLAQHFGLETAPFTGEGVPLEKQLADSAPTWTKIAEKHHLQEPDITRLTSPWHTDADLGRPIEVVTDMSKSRKLGFMAYQATEDAFLELFTVLKEKQLIPSVKP